MDYSAFKKLCNQRRSVRYFSDDPTSKEEILELLSLASLAPSVENIQPWHFHVILNPELREKMMEASCYGNFTAGAAAFIVVTCDTTAQTRAPEVMWNPKEMEYSCVSAIEHVLLGATAKGLGSCWVSLHHGKAHEILGTPETHVIVGGVMLGHLKRGEEPVSDGHHERRPLEETYTLHE